MHKNGFLFHSSVQPLIYLLIYLFKLHIKTDECFFWKMLKSFKLLKNGCKSDQFFYLPITYLRGYKSNIRKN
jgi:hypothetical protein